MLKQTVSLILLSLSLQSTEDLFLHVLTSYKEDHTPGFIALTPDDDLFFWLFRARSTPETAPLTVWLTGGPGCASELAIFYENGPFSINDDLSLRKNEFSWNNQANMLYVDQPIGTGFSKAKLVDYVKTEDEIAKDFFTFL